MMNNRIENENISVHVREIRRVPFSEFEEKQNKPIKTVSDLFGDEPKYLTLDELMPVLERQREKELEDKILGLLVSKGEKNILSSVEVLRSVYHEYNTNIALVKLLQDELRKPTGMYTGNLEKNIAKIVCPIFSIGKHPERIDLDATICMSCDYSPMKNNGKFCDSPQHEIVEMFMLKTSQSYTNVKGDKK